LVLVANLNSVAFRPLYPYTTFPMRVNSHLTRCPSTPQVEAIGSRLVLRLQAGAATPAELWNFIVAVCDWGGKTGNRVRGLIQRNYIAHVTMTRFTNAVNILAPVNATTDPIVLVGTINRAIDEMTAIGGLATSYGSKMLRFLRPDICGVFDSLLATNTGFACNNANFAQYSVDCLVVAGHLARLGIVNPRTGTTTWRAGDVDQALFACIQGW